MPASRSVALTVCSVVMWLGCSSGGGGHVALPASASASAARVALSGALGTTPTPADHQPAAGPSDSEGAPEDELDPGPERIASERFAPVIYAGGMRVVLSSQPREDWAVGAPELISDGSPVVVRRDVDFAALSDEIRSRLDTEVHLLGSHGRVCTARLGRLSIIGRSEPHFSVRQGWRGDVEQQEPPSTVAQIAQNGWDLSEGGRVLVADVAAVEGNCRNATWARSALLATPTVTPAEQPTAQLRARAIAELRALPGHAELQKQLAEMEPTAATTPWDEYAAARPTVAMIHPAGSDTALLFVSASAGIGCGGFFGRMSAVFEVTDPRTFPRFSLLTDSLPGDGFAPEVPDAAADLDGDGTLELLVTEGLITDLGRDTKRRALEVPFLDCPC